MSDKLFLIKKNEGKIAEQFIAQHLCCLGRRTASPVLTSIPPRFNISVIASPIRRRADKSSVNCYPCLFIWSNSYPEFLNQSE